MFKAGDYIQLGTGASAHLHKVLEDVNSDGSGNATLTIWPALRESPANNDAITVSNTVGLFRMTSNSMNWSVETMQLYGMSFSAVEAL